MIASNTGKIILHVKEGKDFNTVLIYVKKALHEYCVEPYLEKIEPGQSLDLHETLINALDVIHHATKNPELFDSLSRNKKNEIREHPIIRDIEDLLQ